MTTTAWREEPIFVLEGLDSLGHEVVSRLHRELEYRSLYDCDTGERAEVWRCWLGRSSCLAALPVTGAEASWPERDGLRDLLIVVGKAPMPTDVARQANHVIQVLADAGQDEAEALAAFMRQWFDLLVNPGIINADWKDVRNMLEPGLPCYAVSSRVAGCDLAAQAGQKVHERLVSCVSETSRPGGLLVTLTAGDDLGLSAFSAVGEALYALVGEADEFIVATILRPQVELEVWAMMLVHVPRHNSIMLED